MSELGNRLGAATSRSRMACPRHLVGGRMWHRPIDVAVVYMTDKRIAKKSLDISPRRMLVKRHGAETLTSDHRLLHDIPSFKPNTLSPEQGQIKRLPERSRVLREIKQMSK